MDSPALSACIVRTEASNFASQWAIRRESSSHGDAGQKEEEIKKPNDVDRFLKPHTKKMTKVCRSIVNVP